MADFLIEFYNEEMPASFLKESVENIKNIIKGRLIKENVKFEKEECFFTPKRITIIFLSLKLELDRSKNLIKGPRFDSPDQAIVGFAKSFNTNKNKLIVKNTEKGKYYFFKNISKPDIKKLLKIIIETELKKITWKKSMRWGKNNLKWARPLKNILCLYDNKKISFSFAHLLSSDKTLKDNYLNEKHYKVKSIDHYFELMDEFEVIISQKARKEKIIADSKRVLGNKKLFIKHDEKLMNEVSSLIEIPYLFLAKFRENYLNLPEEILITTMKKNQKYFPLYNSKNKLSNYFLLVSNIKSSNNGKTIIEGNQRVVNARLEDAVFFWNRDKRNKFEKFFNELNKIIFHSELGTIQQKVIRLKDLSLFLSLKLKQKKKIKTDFLDAVKLLKNDLATEVVKEFPELQGIVGSYYASEEKYNNRVCDAISQQYKPLGPNDDLPKTKLAKLSALVDKIDTLVGFFIIGREPTSSKDPLAIRRTALGIIRIIIEGKINIDLSEIISEAISNYKNSEVQEKVFSSDFSKNISKKILNFILERYENSIKEKNPFYNLLFQSLKINTLKLNLLEINNNLIYLNKFFKTNSGLNLLNAVKRVMNIVVTENEFEKKTILEPNPKLFELKEEFRLYELVKKHTEENTLDYKNLMKNFSLLVKPIENFFDNVQIHHQNDDLKKNRLVLLLYVNDRINKNISFLNLIKGN